MRKVLFIAPLMVVLCSCTGASENGQPTAETIAVNPTDPAPSPTASSTGLPSSTSTVGDALDDVEACSIIAPSSLPSAWGPLTVDPDPLLKLAASNCTLTNEQSGLGINILVYKGPGQGVVELSKTTASTPVDTTVAGRPAKTYQDASVKTCGVLLDFGPDQAVAVQAAPPLDMSIDACDIAATAATAMAPNLPPS